VEFRILGPLELADDGRPLPLGRGKQKALLALLLLHANEVVSAEQLIDELWGEAPPATVDNALQNYVSRLRKRLGERLLTRSPGYLLRVEPGELDLARFEDLLGQARAVDEPEATADRLSEALALWRGSALADFTFEPFAQSEIVRLEDLRLAAVEERIQADLALGRETHLVAELEALVARHPLRERFWAQLMLALYRSGRQAEALEAYQAARETLVEQIGIEPGDELRTLQRRILEQDASLTVPRAARAEPQPSEAERPPQLSAATEAPREQRKTVTVVFCDVVDWTRLGDSLDPELVRGLVARFHDSASAVFERHGGTVAKYAGDAVMAVFGIPHLHEDDALRALRAASELPAALADFADELRRRGYESSIRAGVNTGEVIAGGEALVTGDAVNVAARLADAAASGEVLLGDATWRLVRQAVRAEPQEIEVKGKAKPVRVWALHELLPADTGLERTFHTPFIGRDRELSKLRAAFADAAERRTSHLFTVLGPAGIGKSRIASEFAALVESEAGRFLFGRCLPYGEGITYWPLVEILRHLGDDVGAAVTEALDGEPNAAAIAEQLAGVAGQGRISGTEADIFWAARRLFEQLAHRQPLVLVFEDVHWGEPTFLDLVEYVAELARDAPLFLLCLARPELLDDRPGWAGGKVNATSLLLDPLSEADSDVLVDVLLRGTPLASEARRRIAAAAEGNPLFVEQLLAMVREGETAAEELEIPPTIQALLAARLDRLGPAERAVVEAAAVVGKEFWLEAVAEVLPEQARASLDRHVEALVRKELVRPAQSVFFDRGGYRFGHILVRDAAYRGVPKALRADLHERFARWLEAHADARGDEYHEILGHHFEQAARYRVELDPGDPVAPALAETAAEFLAEAGKRVHGRDYDAAAKLLSRTSALLPAGDVRRVHSLVELAYAYRQTGAYAESLAVADEALESAKALRNERLELLASLVKALLRWSGESTDAALAELLAAAETAAPVLEASGDHRWLARALKFVGYVQLLTLRTQQAEQPLLRGLRAAREADDYVEWDAIFSHLAYYFVHGRTPASEAIKRSEELLAERPDWLTTRESDADLAPLHAMQGRFAKARRLIDGSITATQEHGRRIGLPVKLGRLADLELAAGDPRAAERAARLAYASAKEIAGRHHLGDTALTLARVLLTQGHDEEALRFAEAAERLVGDVRGAFHIDCRLVKARVFARRGQPEEALRLAREAIEAIDPEQAPYDAASYEVEYADVLRRAGQTDEARAALGEAIALADRKEDLVTAAAARAALEELAAPAARQ
jgi:class 3 adenylate cyclase